MDRIQGRTTSPETCPDRQLLILDAVRPEVLPAALREQVFEHLCACGQCAELYEEICGLHGGATAGLAGDASLQAAGLMTQEEAQQDVWQRIAGQEAQAKNDHRRQLVRRVAKVAIAMAACLLLAVSVSWWYDAGQSPKPLVAKSTSQSSPAAKRDLPASTNPLGGDITALIPQPELFDPAKVDYATWLKDHESWFAATFPWIFDAQKVLQAKGIQADYVELLMVSGDIWQFRFDPDGPIDQPLAAYSPVAMGRLAKHYKLPAESLRESIVCAVSGTRSSNYGDMSAAASLQRWKTAIASAASGSGAEKTDLRLTSLRSAIYLRNGRAAACMWAARNPELLQGVFASSRRAASDSSVSASVSVQSLSQQCTAAEQMIHEAMRLLTRSPSNSCGEAGEQWHRMAECLLAIKENAL